MNKTWDGTGIAFDPETWKAALRVLKPGGHLLAFGGTRTHHRLMCAIEDAGFELRDVLMWIHGQGFPKSLSVSKAIDREAGADREVIGGYVHTGSRSGGIQGNDAGHQWHDITAPATDAAKQWDGWHTALKPSYEPIILARAPIHSTIAANVRRYGTGALNIDASRVAATDNVTYARWGGARSREEYRTGSTLGPAIPTDVCRWPANLLLDREAAALLDEQAGEHPSGMGQGGKRELRRTDKNNRNEGTTIGKGWDASAGAYAGEAYGDTGGPSRFFKIVEHDEQLRFRYVSKTSTGEREAGLDSMQTVNTRETVGRDPESAGTRNPRAGAGRGAGAPIYRCSACELNLQGGRAASVCAETEDGVHVPVKVGVGKERSNLHPTVKPLDLMRWLVSLVTPPNGIILDCFAGSGSTLLAAAGLGFRSIGVEQDAHYCEIIKQRIVGNDVVAQLLGETDGETD